jgi:hypothetical protein
MKTEMVFGGPRKVKRELLESDVENPCKAWAKARGWYVRKFKSPANRSAPDDIFLKDGMTYYCEFKRPKKDATPKQKEEHKKIRAAGGTVVVMDDIEKFKTWIRWLESQEPHKKQDWLS